MSFKYSKVIAKTPTQKHSRESNVELSCGHTLVMNDKSIKQRMKCPLCYPSETTMHVSSRGVSAASHVRFARAGRAVTRWQRRTGKSMY